MLKWYYWQVATFSLQMCSRALTPNVYRYEMFHLINPSLTALDWQWYIFWSTCTFPDTIRLSICTEKGPVARNLTRCENLAILNFLCIWINEQGLLKCRCFKIYQCHSCTVNLGLIRWSLLTLAWKDKSHYQQNAFMKCFILIFSNSW